MVGSMMQKEGEAVTGGKINLYEAGTGGRARGNDRFVRKSSVFLELQKRPQLMAGWPRGLTVAAVVGSSASRAVKTEMKVRRRVSRSGRAKRVGPPGCRNTGPAWL
jgi:hypothetical protein